MSYVESSNYESVTGLELKIQEAEKALNQARKDLKEYQRRRNLDLLHKVGDLTVIRFTKSWNRWEAALTYHYAGIKVNGTWSVTGHASSTRYIKYTSDLIEFIGDGDVTIMTPDKTL